MATPATSELRFVDLQGRPIAAPVEWEPAKVVLPVPVEDWEGAELAVQGGARCEVKLALVDGAPAAVADWDRRGAGYWRCVVRLRGNEVHSQNVLIWPKKLDEAAFEAMLADIDERLIGSILYSLDQLGAFAGQKQRPPAPTTLAEELHRLRRAVLGDDQGAGLAVALSRIAEDPHYVLAADPVWVRSENARAPIGNRLESAYASPANTRRATQDSVTTLEKVWDARVRRSLDTYENRILKAFVVDVDRRLRRLSGRLGVAHPQLRMIEDAFRIAFRKARFLQEVGEWKGGSHAPSMVFVKRRDYQIGYRRWIQFRRIATLTILLSARASPIHNTPFLYEVWGTLLSLISLLDVAARTGWSVRKQQLFVLRDSWYADLEWQGRAILRLTRSEGEVIQVRPQRSFRSGGPHFESISLTQRPDLVIEVRRAAEKPFLLVIDPKYKLAADGFTEALERQLENDDRELARAGQPVKADIDKMHAYRDAIRRSTGEAAVEWAGIIYPGTESIDHSGLVAAVGARPGSSAKAERHLSDTFHRFFT